MCNVSLTQCCLEIELVNFGSETLLSSYGVICSPWRLFFTIRSPSTSKLPRTDCFPTWQYYLHHKRDDDSGETSRTSVSKPGFTAMTACHNDQLLSIFFTDARTCIDGVGLRLFRNAHAHLTSYFASWLWISTREYQALAFNLLWSCSVRESLSCSCTRVLVQLLFVSGGRSIATGFTLNLVGWLPSLSLVRGLLVNWSSVVLFITTYCYNCHR